jgi:hypothetical protein
MPEGGRHLSARLFSAGRVEVADALFELMPRDAVFALRLLGESRSRLLQHFHALILAELAKLGATPETHPMLSAFAETHALALRDFVVSGVEIAHQFRIEEIERLTGDSGGLLRVDVWDRLKSYIAAAESQFQRQVVGMREQIDAYRAPATDVDRASETR